MTSRYKIPRSVRIIKGSRSSRKDKSLPGTNNENRILKTLNSPFIVTLIGGIIISLLGIFLQKEYSEFQKKIEFSRKLILIKKDTLTNFSMSMDRYLTLSHSNRKRAIYIKAWGNAKKKNNDLKIPNYPDGKSYSETIIEYETQRKSIFSKITPDSLCATSIAIFDNESLLKILNSLQQEIEMFSSTFDINVLNEKFQLCINLSNQATALMAFEIKGNIENEIKK